MSMLDGEQPVTRSGFSPFVALRLDRKNHCSKGRGRRRVCILIFYGMAHSIYRVQVSKNVPGFYKRIKGSTICNVQLCTFTHALL